MKRKAKVKPQRRPSRPHRRSASRAIVPAQVPPSDPLVYRGGRGLLLNREQVDLIKRLCAKDTTQDEFALFMQICRKSKLDPFRKEIYCIIWPTEQGRSHEMVIVTGIGGFRTMAARDHKDYGGSSDGEFTWFEPPRKTPAGKPIPRSCTVLIHAKAGPDTKSTVWWEEYAPADLTTKKADFWNRMPCNMLEKVAEAKGLRKRFPGLNNIFVDAELDQRAQDFTEGNRQINMGGVAPSGKILDHSLRDPKQLTQREEAIQRLKAAGRWCDKHQCPKMKCPVDEHTKAENDEAYEAERRYTNSSSSAPAEKKPAPVPENKKVAEVWPKGGVPPAKQTARTQEAKATVKAPEESRTAPRRGRETTMDGADLLAGALSKVVHAKKKNGDPVLNCQINNTWYACYRKSIFEWLTEGQFIKVYIDPSSKTLIGIAKAKGTEFERDGKTPKALSVDREAGTPSLWPREPGEEA